MRPASCSRSTFRLIPAFVVLLAFTSAWAQNPGASSLGASPALQATQGAVPNSQPTTPVPSGQQTENSAPAGVQSPAETQAPATQPENPSQAGPDSGQEPTANDQGGMFVFKKEVEEVVLHATVYDEQQRLVSGLGQSAFTVMEEGVPQTITSFRRQDVPVAMGIVIDNSGSMRDKRDEVNRAVLNLIRASNPQDQIFVVNFSKLYYLDQDFTSDEHLLQTALHQVSSSGSTALYDAVVASAVHLQNNQQLEKRVLLVITDGEDNMSQETLQEAMRRLQHTNGPTVYAIGLTGGDLQGRGREALQRLAQGTGGVAYFPDTVDQVGDITRTVAHDIRTQYTISYRPTKQNIKPEDRAVRVIAQASGYGRLNVKTRSGYSFGNQQAGSAAAQAPVSQPPHQK